jgi:hypothetical protein
MPTLTNPKLQAFSKVACQALRHDLEQLLMKFAHDNGLNMQFHVGNMKFFPGEVDIKLKATLNAAKNTASPEAPKTKESAALEQNIRFYNLNLESRDSMKVLIGFNTRAPRFPFIYLDRNTGLRYKASLASVKTHFGK